MPTSVQPLCAELRSCVKVEVDVLGSQSLIVRTISVDVKQQWTWTFRAEELCERRVAVLGSPSLIVRTVSVDVKQHWTELKPLCLWQQSLGDIGYSDTASHKCSASHDPTCLQIGTEGMEERTGLITIRIIDTFITVFISTPTGLTNVYCRPNQFLN